MSNTVLDHHQAFAVLFAYYQSRQRCINKFLEFGLGAGTEYFLQQCTQVTSVELSYDGNAKWFDRCKNGYRNYHNWDAHFFVLPKSVSQAEYRIRAGQGKDVYKEAVTYLNDLQQVIYPFVPTSEFNLVFVDPGVHLRADIINMLFDRVPIIVAHDTYQLPHYYGWDRVVAPSHYAKFIFPTKAGVTLWFDHTQSDIVHYFEGANCD